MNVRSYLSILTVFITSCSALRAQDQVLQFDGTAAGGFSGAAVANVGDINGDGIDDHAVAAPQSNAFQGQIIIRSGRDNAQLAVLSESLNDPNGGTADTFGAAIASVGDVNGDGRDDFVVSGPEFSLPQASSGRAQLLSGLDFSELEFLVGAGFGDRLGVSVAGLGDINSDGAADWGAGAPLGGSNGYARIMKSTTGTFLSFGGAFPGDRFGISMTGLGDVSGDGVPDFAIGADQANTTIGARTGYVMIINGATESLMRTDFGSAAGDQFGASLVGVGDVNNNGTGDYLVGAPGNGAGYARLVDGGNGLTIQQFFGDTASDQFGRAVAVVSDMDSDGLSDLAVGAPAEAAIPARSGYLRVFSSGTGAVLFTSADGPGTEGDAFGFSIVDLGDIAPLDGVSDLLVGAPRDDNAGADAGSAKIVSGAPLSLPTLTSAQTVISLSAGGSVTLEMTTDPADAGKFHWMFGSVTGTTGMLCLNGISVPLAFDAYTQQRLRTPLAAPISNGLGVIAGTQTLATFNVNPGTDPSLAGLVVYHASVVTDTAFNCEKATNPVALTLVP